VSIINREVVIMAIDQQSGTGVLRMSFCEVMDADDLNMAAAGIRALPGIQRVRIVPAANQLEILYIHPTKGLLQQIHTVLQSVNRDCVALKF
jgi:hypothetical protein